MMAVLKRHSSRMGSVFVILILTGLPVMSASGPDPMKALTGRAAGADPLDPMSALIARQANEDASKGNEEFGGLPDGPGAEDTYYQCVACHSTDIIRQQRVTDLRWDEMWNWMVEKQGMVEPDDETKQVILTYLKTHFSSER